MKNQKALFGQRETANLTPAQQDTLADRIVRFFLFRGQKTETTTPNPARDSVHNENGVVYETHDGENKLKNKQFSGKVTSGGKIIDSNGNRILETDYSKNLAAGKYKNGLLVKPLSKVKREPFQKL